MGLSGWAAILRVYCRASFSVRSLRDGSFAFVYKDSIGDVLKGLTFEWFVCWQTHILLARNRVLI